LPPSRSRLAIALAIVGLTALVAVLLVSMRRGDERSTRGGTAAPSTVPSPSVSSPPVSSPTASGREQVRLSGKIAALHRVVDTVPGGPQGTVATFNGGTVTSVTEDGNPFLRFPSDHCNAAPCPQAVVQLPGRLAPGNRPFSFGADVRLAGPPSPNAGMNVFQSGVAAEGASQWKLQIDYGHAACRWSDGTKTVLAPEHKRDPKFALEPGRWYTVRCERTASGEYTITIRPRGSTDVVATASIPDPGLAPIVPKEKLTIGGKNIGPDRSDAQTDQFHGDLDEIVYSVG
jgi:hypothetical protein